MPLPVHIMELFLRRDNCPIPDWARFVKMESNSIFTFCCKKEVSSNAKKLLNEQRKSLP